MDISSIMDTQINVLDSVLYKHICVLLSLMMQGVNMVPVVLYNTAHKLISKVYQLGTLPGVEKNVRWTWHPCTEPVLNPPRHF